jgi:hypothetical protein
LQNKRWDADDAEKRQDRRGSDTNQSVRSYAVGALGKISVAVSP